MFLDNIPSNYSLEPNDMSQNNDSIKPNYEITKDEINTIVNSETLQKAIKDSHDAWEKTKFKWQIFVALVMALSAALGYYLKWDSDRKDLIEQQIQAANERKAEQIQAEINLKMEWMRRADEAIMNMRKTRELIVIGCDYNLPRNRMAEDISRFNARYNVANTFTGIRFIFNNDVENKSQQLVKFDENVKDVCSKSAPEDNIWREYVIQINNLMEKSVQDEQNKLANIQKYSMLID